MSRTTAESVDERSVIYGSLVRRAAAFWLEWFVLAAIYRGLGISGAGGLIIGAVYFGALEGLTGATLVERLMGLRVVDDVTLTPIGIPRALLRYVARFLSLLPLGAGFLVASSDLQSRGWHDMLVHSVVINAA